MESLSYNDTTTLADTWWRNIISEESYGAVLSKEPAYVYHPSTDADGSVGNDGPIEVGRVSDGGRAADAEENIASPSSVYEEDLSTHRGQERRAGLEEELAAGASAAVKTVWASLSHDTAAEVLISTELATPGGNPLTEDPGDKPIGPWTTVLPEFVIVVAAHTPKPAAVEPKVNLPIVNPMVNACAAVAASKSRIAKESG
ncbi:MAG: hypothetical protein M1830_003972 [Pleopsidium flavum]|nr:MAG: hypothetical protein M1830_003972 [Pleopsidium flavum]